VSETPNQDDCRGTLVRGSDGVLFCPDCGWRIEPGSPKYRTPKPTALETKDAEIASLRAQLDEARARVKTFEMAIAQLPEMPAIMDERAARRRAIEDAANVVARSVFPLPTDAEIARDGGGIAVMRAAAMARDAIEQQIRALLSESKP
jgi:uncharacterized Zn finger protein (UPF0148 family)